jgi:hypothetical protein
MIAAVTNAKSYAWADWFIGIMRSFLSGGAVAFTTGTGGAVLGIPSDMVWKLMLINFVLMGLYRMGEFLQLHGAPDQLQTALATAADATAKAGDAIATAQSAVPEVKPPTT